MSRLSSSNETNDEQSQPKPWLLKHYQEKRQRTVTLVKDSVDQLIKEKQTVTIEAICHKSAQIDEEGRGVKKSAVLENQEAHAYYRVHTAPPTERRQHANELAKRRKPRYKHILCASSCIVMLIERDIATCR
jgi:hypothetical protein